MPQTLEDASGNLFTMPAHLFVRGFDRPVDNRIVEFDGGDVAQRPPVRRASRGIIEGLVKGTDFQDAQANLDALLAILRNPPVKLRLFSSTSRFLLVYPEFMDDTQTTLSHRATVAIPVVAPDPLWFGSTITNNSLRTGTVSFTVVNNGNARTATIITISGAAATNFEIRNDTLGQTFAHSGSLASNEQLVIDGGRRTATINGVNILSSVNDAFLAFGLWLAPGANTIRVVNAGASQSVSIQYTERFE